MSHRDEHIGASADDKEQQLLRLLRDYPMPQAEQAFYDQALVRAAHTGTRRQRNRWIMTGFGAAAAAGVLILIVSGLFLGTTQAPQINDAIPGVTIALAEPKTVNLVFASAQPLDDATLTVLLPEGVELAGFPGQREVSWQTSLAAGRNLLPLELIATAATGGNVVARLEHEDKNRTFRLRVNVG